MRCNKFQILKFLIFLMSSIMFFIQLKNSLHKLINPVVADTTKTIDRSKIPLPIITICPSFQIKEAKVKELGYESFVDMFHGLKTVDNVTHVTWKYNDTLNTFSKLLDFSLNYTTNYSQIGLHINEIADGIQRKDKYTDQLKRKFYVGFWGYCWELEHYDISKIIEVHAIPGRHYEVFVTMKEENIFFALNTDSHSGNLLLTDKNLQTWFDIKISKYSHADPRNKDQCKTYTNEMFEKCIDEKIQSKVKPILGCNPTWLSVQDQCKELNITMKQKDVNIYREFIIPIIFRNNLVTQLCSKPCIQFNFDAKTKTIFTDMNHSIMLSFHQDVHYTKKYLTYDFSFFLIDMGSSLGLWFGLSVFGLTDLCILVVNIIR